MHFDGSYGSCGQIILLLLFKLIIRYFSKTKLRQHYKKFLLILRIFPVNNKIDLGQNSIYIPHVSSLL